MAAMRGCAGLLDTALSDGTLEQIRRVGGALDARMRATHHYPERLSEMLSGPDALDKRSMHDAWKQPLVYVRTGEDFDLCSIGLDGEYGTDDDICYGRR